jgi:hypothetical protein
MSRATLLSHYCELFKKIYDPELFHQRLNGWMTQVNYQSNLYTQKKFDARQLSHGLRMITYFLLSAQPEVRRLFWQSMIRTWEINPKLMRRAFTFLAQYHHFYDFVRDKLPVRI